jgi:hypothetical protein
LGGEISVSYPIVAYKITHNLGHLDSLPEDPMDRRYGQAEDHDALIYKPTQAEEVGAGLIENVEPYEVPEPVDWVGFLDRLHQTDYFYNDLSWPLISKRMLYVLRSVGEFPHKTISTRIYDFGFQNQGRDRFLDHHVPPDGEFIEDYVGLQLLEHVDGIDYDQSEFRFRLNPNLPLYVTSLILKEPIGGFPPIFRLDRTGEDLSLFVSPAAKEALEEAGIKGLIFLNTKAPVFKKPAQLAK